MIENVRDLEYFIKAGDFETIFVDLDGVVANFNREYYINTGMKAEDDPSKVWDIFVPWVEDGFFCTLRPIRPTVALVHRLKRAGYDVRTLTSCGPYGRTFKDIKNQKKYWCNKYLNGIPQLFVEKGTDKRYFVKNGKKSLLIDDQLKNVKAFIDYGGSGVYYTPDYGYLEDNPTTTLEEEISELHEALDTAELENAELKNPIYTEEKMRGIISDWNDKQWKQYCNDERTW